MTVWSFGSKRGRSFFKVAACGSSEDYRRPKVKRKANKHIMRNISATKNTHARKRQNRLACPKCLRFVIERPPVRDFRFKSDALLPTPGVLTLCEHCETILEYDDQMTLRPASAKRVRAFNALAKELPSQPEISALLRYIAKFSRMPDPNRELFYSDWKYKSEHPL